VNHKRRSAQARKATLAASRVGELLEERFRPPELPPSTANGNPLPAPPVCPQPPPKRQSPQLETSRDAPERVPRCWHSRAYGRARMRRFAARRAITTTGAVTLPFELT